MNTTRFPQISIALATLSFAALAAVAGCSTENNDDHTQMQKNCDMQQMDMSKMSAEEQQKMIDDCKEKMDSHEGAPHGHLKPQ